MTTKNRNNRTVEELVENGEVAVVNSATGEVKERTDMTTEVPLAPHVPTLKELAEAKIAELMLEVAKVTKTIATASFVDSFLAFSNENVEFMELPEVENDVPIKLIFNVKTRTFIPDYGVKASTTTSTNGAKTRSVFDWSKVKIDGESVPMSGDKLPNWAETLIKFKLDPMVLKIGSSLDRIEFIKKTHTVSLT